MIIHYIKNEDLTNFILHRNGKPAFFLDDVSEYWYKHNKLHRIGGPAITYPNGIKSYWVLGKRQT